MRARRSIMSSCTPSSAWATRPLASGARLVVIARRACSSVEVGCPSFGGQRSGGGGFSRLLAGLVTSSMLRRTAKQAGASSAPSSSRTARAVASSTVGRHLAASKGVVGVCTVTLNALGHEQKATSAKAGLTGTAEHQRQVQQGRAPFGLSVEPRSARPSRKGRFASSGATLAPNPSVKGTSRKRAAPYVER